MRTFSKISTAVMIALNTGAASAGKTFDGPMAFDPIPGSAYNLTSNWGDTHFSIPEGYRQYPDGRLWIVEDNSPSDIWVADKDLDGDGLSDNVQLFASLRDGSWDCDEEVGGNCLDWDDDGAEGTDIYFGKDPHTLFVNIQHAEAEFRDGTWAITNRKMK